MNKLSLKSIDTRVRNFVFTISILLKTGLVIAMLALLFGGKLSDQNGLEDSQERFPKYIHWSSETKPMDIVDVHRQ